MDWKTQNFTEDLLPEFVKVLQMPVQAIYPVP